MTASQETEKTGHARFTYRLRVSSTALTKLLGEWARCRWVWNECCARSQKARAGDEECGPARLDKMLTEARTTNTWLREGSSVPQQQLVRDFGKSRTKALMDIKARLPVRQRAGMPKYKKRYAADPSLNYTRRGLRIKDGRLHLSGGVMLTVVWSRHLPADPSSVRIYRDSLGHWYASFVVATSPQPLPETDAAIGIDWGVRETATTTSDTHDLPHAEHGRKAAAGLAADAAIGAAKRELITMARKHGRIVHLVHPAHTTMDCAQCGARTKHALPLSERSYTCTVCGAVSPRDKNSARVMPVRAGLNPAGADRARAAGPQVHSQREPGIPAFGARRSQGEPPSPLHAKVYS
ncbi:RNA-guided endonuclease InsQ/TnpB family protein [Streptomyces sp. NBC_00503]|uniref:RNA-guided endonuclease InsQ/TnpB family protein n=1 Tax=Streptomyces sp. NBC_00503 TaxID=2903659 RepID=UPI002E82306F|nr:transposase [Streptomyces sp. NBC_00503]WUD80823.1 transposase [Streptomyces sp. NBC_00503]